MGNYLSMQSEWLLRLIVAGACGFAIGYERNNRRKEAGVRTHLIVALGAALIMIVSKYAFADMLGMSGVSLDPSRIAAQVVSGIGFLGAGMIFVRNQSVNGLTTAAGIWTTAGIGMAIGGQLYIVGVGATVLVVVAQIVLHSNLHHLPGSLDEIKLVFAKDTGALAFVHDVFVQEGLIIDNIKVSQKHDNLVVEIQIKAARNFDILKLVEQLKQNPAITTIEY